MLGLADPLKAEAWEVVQQLKAEGIDVVILSGDHEESVRAVAAQLGVAEVAAGVLPEQKAERLRDLRAEGRKVAMVGDGINDAPALAVADVGIAMGAGTDIARQTAGVTLVSGDLRGLLRAIRLSEATMRNVGQNLLFAFGYNALGVPLAAGVLYPLTGLLLTPAFAAAAMSLSSVSVIGTRTIRNARTRRRARTRWAWITCVYADATGSEVRISPAVINNLGVRTEAATVAALPRRAQTVGFVSFDDRRVRQVRPRADGWIEGLSVRAPGEIVSVGQLLFTVYSPMLESAQQEYLDAIRIGNDDLVAASRDRLRALGLDSGTVLRLASSGRASGRVPFHAPVAGVVTELAIREGAMVTPDMMAMTITELGSLWVIAEVPESQAGWVTPGTVAELRFPSLPGKTLEGHVQHVYPELNMETRTVRARIVLERARCRDPRQHARQRHAARRGGRRCGDDPAQCADPRRRRGPRRDRSRRGPVRPAARRGRCGERRARRHPGGTRGRRAGRRRRAVPARFGGEPARGIRAAR